MIDVTAQWVGKPGLARVNHPGTSVVLFMSLLLPVISSAAVRESASFKLLSDGVVAGAGHTSSDQNTLFSIIGDSRPVGSLRSDSFKLNGGTIQFSVATDPDGDGTPDAADNCPGVHNPDQSDTDSDSAGDACDADDDNDGVADASDSNSLNPNICQDLDTDGCDDCGVGTDGFGSQTDFDPFNDGTDTNGDGICDFTDPDDDGDGFDDGEDNCPLVDNPSQTDSDNNGVGNVCEDANICVGPDELLINTDFSGLIYCATGSSITAGGQDADAVTIKNNADAVFTAPLIELKPVFNVETGAKFRAGDDLPEPTVE